MTGISAENPPIVSETRIIVLPPGNFHLFIPIMLMPFFTVFAAFGFCRLTRLDFCLQFCLFFCLPANCISAPGFRLTFDFRLPLNHGLTLRLHCPALFLCCLPLGFHCSTLSLCLPLCRLPLGFHCAALLFCGLSLCRLPLGLHCSTLSLCLPLCRLPLGLHCSTLSLCLSLCRLPLGFHCSTLSLCLPLCRLPLGFCRTASGFRCILLSEAGTCYPQCEQQNHSQFQLCLAACAHRFFRFFTTCFEQCSGTFLFQNFIFHRSALRSGY